MAQPPKRPGLLDLRSKSTASNASSSSRPLRSPRLHLAGEVPPELSPLDAFAMQSRLLAKQLTNDDTEGKRKSRLPPLTAESPLVVQARSDYFRSMSQDSGSDGSPSPEPYPEGLGLRTEVEEAAQRPMSMHPRMSRIPPTPDDGIPLVPDLSEEATANRGRELNRINEDDYLFGGRREQSPTPIESTTPTEENPSRFSSPNKQASSLPAQSPYKSNSVNTSPEKSAKKNSFEGPGLAPPRSTILKRSPSTMSSPLETTDEESVMGNSFHSLPPRKLSSGSSAFSSVPAISPALSSVPHRSPSISSEASAPLPRPSFNFSRPLSRAGTPAPETPSRQASSDTQASFVLADDSAHTPMSMSSEGFPDSHVDDGKAAAPSYIYSKFSLPRGKNVQRSVPLDTQPPPSFCWEQPIALPSNVQTVSHDGIPPSPPIRPCSASGRPFPDTMGLTRPPLDLSKRSMDHSDFRNQTPQKLESPFTEAGRVSEDAPRGRALTSPQHDAGRLKTAISIGTSDSASTLKAARSQYSSATATTTSEMTAEEHVAKGVECHENGFVQQSTYHLRHAAKLNHPTGMLLYALACRHGWGMRPNQKEGVEWLRKAVDAVGAELADDEGNVREGRFVDKLESKTRKAQFALSVYELGVSHMNGWGIEQDRSLGLRCYEIAGCK